jgi:GAF domain-containing protein
MPSHLPRDPSVLLRTLVESTTVADTVEQITAFAAETFGTPFVGTTLIRKQGKRLETAGPTDPVVRQADELQHSLREGPCVDSATQSRTLVSNDLASEARWPTWAPQVAALGLRSVLSSEIHSATDRVGALNIYGTAPRTFTHEDTEVARMLAAQAGVALQVSQKVEGLMTALDSRTTIGQAQGILMNHFSLDEDRAFSVLKRLSQDRNVRLAEVARQIVAGDLHM